MQEKLQKEQRLSFFIELFVSASVAMDHNISTAAVNTAKGIIIHHPEQRFSF